MPQVLIQLPDPLLSAIRDGLYPGDVNNQIAINRSAWDTLQNAVGLNVSSGFNDVTQLTSKTFTANGGGSVAANQSPALAALWLAWQDVNVSDQSRSLGDFGSDGPLLATAYGVTDANQATFISAFSKYAAEFASARDAWVANYPATMAYVSGQQKFQAAFARGTVFAGPTVQAWPAEYVQEGPVTLPDGNVYLVVYDPRNTDVPDGISVLWWKGPLYRPEVDNPANGTVKINATLFPIPDAGTGSWYIASWAGEYCVPPVGWVPDSGALMSSRAKNSLQLPSSSQQIRVMSGPTASPSNPLPPGTVTLPPAPIQPVPPGGNLPPVANPTAGTSQPLGGAIAPSAVQQPVSSTPPTAPGFGVIGAVVVAGVVVYLLTREG